VETKKGRAKKFNRKNRTFFSLFLICFIRLKIAFIRHNSSWIENIVNFLEVGGTNIGKTKAGKTEIGHI
jgi:hypothetical protein